eukprot:SAG31_NODE_26238_length_445_cov_28.708092_1_plen_31_part_10
MGLLQAGLLEVGCLEVWHQQVHRLLQVGRME